MRGKFITVEGSEGVGKSTNIAFIHSWLESKNVPVVLTREPGGTPLAEDLRKILLENREEKFDVLAELLIVFAARAQHLHELILPALEAGSWVLCDRFTDATFAYQGYGRQLDLQSIAQLETLVQKSRHPDKTFYLDIEVEVGLQRARSRGALDRFEREEIEFFERVRQGYLQRVKDDPERFYLVDANKTLEQVQATIESQLQELYKESFAD